MSFLAVPDTALTAGNMSRPGSATSLTDTSIGRGKWYTGGSVGDLTAWGQDPATGTGPQPGRTAGAECPDHVDHDAEHAEDQISPYTLRFLDDDMEAAFQAHVEPAKRTMYKAAWLITTIATLGTLAAEDMRKRDEARFKHIMIVRFLTIIAFAVVGYLRIISSWGRRNYRALCAATPFILAAPFTALQSFEIAARPAGVEDFYVFSIIIWAVPFLGGILFRDTIAVLPPLTVMFLAVVAIVEEIWTEEGADVGYLAIRGISLVIVLTTSLLGCYQRERDRRLTFVLERAAGDHAEERSVITGDIVRTANKASLGRASVFADLLRENIALLRGVEGTAAAPERKEWSYARVRAGGPAFLASEGSDAVYKATVATLTARALDAPGGAAAPVVLERGHGPVIAVLVPAPPDPSVAAQLGSKTFASASRTGDPASRREQRSLARWWKRTAELLHAVADAHGLRVAGGSAHCFYLIPDPSASATAARGAFAAPGDSADHPKIAAGDGGSKGAGLSPEHHAKPRGRTRADAEAAAAAERACLAAGAAIASLPFARLRAGVAFGEWSLRYDRAIGHISVRAYGGAVESAASLAAAQASVADDDPARGAAADTSTATAFMVTAGIQRCVRAPRDTASDADPWDGHSFEIAAAVPGEENAFRVVVPSNVARRLVAPRALGRQRAGGRARRGAALFSHASTSDSDSVSNGGSATIPGGSVAAASRGVAPRPRGISATTGLSLPGTAVTEAPGGGAHDGAFSTAISEDAAGAVVAEEDHERPMTEVAHLFARARDTVQLGDWKRNIPAFVSSSSPSKEPAAGAAGAAGASGAPLAPAIPARTGSSDIAASINMQRYTVSDTDALSPRSVERSRTPGNRSSIGGVGDSGDLAIELTGMRIGGDDKPAQDELVAAAGAGAADLSSLTRPDATRKMVSDHAVSKATLSFRENEAERDYALQMYSSSLVTLRFIMAFFALMWALAVVVDISHGGDRGRFIAVLRFGAVLPLMLLGILLTFLATLRMHVLLFQLIMGAGAASVLMLAIVMVVAAPSDEITLYGIVILRTAMAVYCNLRLRFVTSCLIGVLMTFGTAYAMYTYDDLSDAPQRKLVTYTLIVNVFGATYSRFLEHSSRKLFLAMVAEHYGGEFAEGTLSMHDALVARTVPSVAPLGDTPGGGGVHDIGIVAVHSGATRDPVLVLRAVEDAARAVSQDEVSAASPEVVATPVRVAGPWTVVAVRSTGGSRHVASATLRLGREVLQRCPKAGPPVAVGVDIGPVRVASVATQGPSAGRVADVTGQTVVNAMILASRSVERGTGQCTSAVAKHVEGQPVGAHLSATPGSAVMTFAA